MQPLRYVGTAYELYPGAKDVRALQAACELVREELYYARLARIWRTSLGQSEVVTGETAAVVLPPAAAVKAIKNERKTTLAVMQIQKSLRPGDKRR